MKVRLAIVVIGVLAGLACKWGLNEWTDVDSRSSAKTAASRQGRPFDHSSDTPIDDSAGHAVDGADEAYVDPLVPPAKVAGLASPLTGLNPLRTLVSSGIYNDLSAADFSSDDRAVFEPHGEQVCASGCAVSRHPTKELTKTAYHRLLRQFLREPVSEDNEALEALLFFGRQTRDMIAQEGLAPLDWQRATKLKAELARTHAMIAIRVVDENGVTRSSLSKTRVPLDRRHVFSMSVNGVQPLVTSGTVKRVGLYHLWTRL